MLPLGSTLSCSLLVFWNRAIIKSSRASRIYLPPPTQRVVRFCVDMTCYGFWGTVAWYPTVLSTILPKPELLSKQTEMNDGNELPELSRGKFQLKRSLSNSVQTLKKKKCINHSRKMKIGWETKSKEWGLFSPWSRNWKMGSSCPLEMGLMECKYAY